MRHSLIVRVTFSDAVNPGGQTVEAGDQLYVQFDRHITLNMSYTPDEAFEFSIPGDTLGTTPSWSQTSGHGVTITLGTGAYITDDGSGIFSGGLRPAALTPPAIRDAWLAGIPGGGGYNSIEGCLGYPAPYLFSAYYDDVDTNGVPSAGDTVTLTFSGDVNVNRPINYWPAETFVLPVTGDFFGWGALATQTDTNMVVITLGDTPYMIVGDVTQIHAVGTYAAGSFSGIDIRIEMVSSFLTYSAGTAEFAVPPTAVDIAP